MHPALLASLAMIAAPASVGCNRAAPAPAPTRAAPAACAPATATATATAPGHDGCALGVSAAAPAAAADARAVTGAPLAVCGTAPLTGFVRDGFCRTGVDDVGAHTVCGAVTAEFLAFTRARGNDLVTPRGGFPGLTPGDRWCLCEGRVAEALAAGVRVPVLLEATNAAALRTLTRAELDQLAAPRAAQAR